MQELDLNIDKILSDWTIGDAIREIISNAIDEQKITKTKDVEIYKKKDKWIIQDFGRGIKPNHFIQNESIEKKEKNNTIGKFGVGLKDAIAVFVRNNIDITIKTNKHLIKPILKLKKGTDKKTIHMKIAPKKLDMSGTIFEIGVKKEDIKIAKMNFLTFDKNKEIIYKNEYGEIYNSTYKKGIYYNGLIISENNDYLFSYNLLTSDATLEKNINRERKSVGKTAFSALLEKIYKNIKDSIIKKKLSDLLSKNKDSIEEMKLKNIRLFAYKNTDANFITEWEFKTLSYRDQELLKNKEIIFIKQSDISNFESDSELFSKFGNNIIKNYYEKLSKNIRVIKNKDLSEQNKSMVKKIYKIYKQLRKKIPKQINFRKKNIFVIKEIIDPISMTETLGLWDQSKKELYISKKALNNKEIAISTFLHEVAHSINDSNDVTKEFEDDLTNLLYICYKDLKWEEK